MTIKGLTAKIVEKKGKITQIEIEGQALCVPTEFLPEKVVAQDEVKIYFSTAADATVSEKQLAKSILEQIMNGN